MVEHLRAAWHRLASSFWLVPAMVALAGIGLAAGMVEVSGTLDWKVLSRYPRIFGADAESSRSALATIAGSIITVAGVTFSITVVVLSQASTQYTPRVLRNFMRDRPSQLSLGVLVAVFLYCLVVIRTIRADGNPDSVPALAIVMAFVLAVAAIAVLIYFIHHIASTMEAGTIVARIHAETMDAIGRTCPDAFSGPGEADEVEPSPPPCERDCVCIEAPRAGYIQSIDIERLVALAGRGGVVFHMTQGVGGFVSQGSALMRVQSTGGPGLKNAAAIRAVTLDTYRTVYQDFGFGLRQIADIALKALSPAMNDTTTAVLCLDYMQSILSRLATRRIERQFRDGRGMTRVVLPGPHFRDLVDTPLNEVRIAGAMNPRVLQRLLTLVEVVGSCAPAGPRRAVLVTQAAQIAATAESGMAAESDRKAIRDESRRVERVLVSGAPGIKPGPVEKSPSG